MEYATSVSQQSPNSCGSSQCSSRSSCRPSSSSSSSCCSRSTRSSTGNCGCRVSSTRSSSVNRPLNSSQSPCASNCQYDMQRPLDAITYSTCRMKIAADVVEDGIADVLTASTGQCEFMTSAGRLSKVRQFPVDDSNVLPQTKSPSRREKLNENKVSLPRPLDEGMQTKPKRSSEDSGIMESLSSDWRRWPGSVFDEDRDSNKQLLLNPEARSLALSKVNERGGAHVGENFTGVQTNLLIDRKGGREIDSKKHGSDGRVSTDKNDDRILVERNGKFLFVNVSELTSSEKNRYTVEKSPAPKKIQKKLVSKSECMVKSTSDRVVKCQINSCNKAASFISKRHSSDISQSHDQGRGKVTGPPASQPPVNRSVFANDATFRGSSHHQMTPFSVIKSDHAPVANTVDGNNEPVKHVPPSTTYVSPYAMSADERRKLARRESDRKLLERMTEKKKQEEEDDKRRRSDEAFKLWLTSKMKTEKREKESSFQPPTSKQREYDEVENEAAFKAWLRMKNFQSAIKTRKLLTKRCRVLTEGFHRHERRSHRQRLLASGLGQRYCGVSNVINER